MFDIGYGGVEPQSSGKLPLAPGIAQAAGDPRPVRGDRGLRWAIYAACHSSPLWSERGLETSHRHVDSLRGSIGGQSLERGGIWQFTNI